MTTFLEELKTRIGEELGVSEWVPMTQEKFDQFAETTGDRDWLHNDPERCARESPFGKTIAQGHLLLSHITQVVETLMPRPKELVYAMNYGYDRVRFIRPVAVGSRIRGRLVLKGIRPKGDGRYVVEGEVTLEAEGESEPCVATRWLFFVQMA